MGIVCPDSPPPCPSRVLILPAFTGRETPAISPKSRGEHRDWVWFDWRLCYCVFWYECMLPLPYCSSLDLIILGFQQHLHASKLQVLDYASGNPCVCGLYQNYRDQYYRARQFRGCLFDEYWRWTIDLRLAWSSWYVNTLPICFIYKSWLRMTAGPISCNLHWRRGCSSQDWDGRV